MDIEGTVAVVTGANRGLGAAFVDELLARGAARVYAGARDPRTLGVADDRVIALQLDVTDGAQVAAAASRCDDALLVINNAGVAHPGPLLGADAVAGLRADLETNVLGTLALAAAFAPVLGANGGGALVDVLSVASFASVPSIPGYSASKAAAWSLTNGLREELAGQGTLVVGLHCGFIDTDLAARVPQPKLDPRDVAAAALDGVETDAAEVLVDELSRIVKARLGADPRELQAALAG